MLSNRVCAGSFHPKPTQRLQGKCMHQNHEYEEFLFMYILFARKIHEHEGIFLNNLLL